MKKRQITAALLIVWALALSSCSTGKSGGENPSSGGELSESVTEVTEPVVISAPEDKAYIFKDNAPVFSLEESFYNADISVELKTANECEIYYTEDGSEPDRSDKLYTEPIYYECEDTKMPTAHTIKAKAYYADGSESEVSVHTYFTAKGTNEHYSEYVFSISGEPSELTEGPDGIFYGENGEERGRESERQVYLSAWDEWGNQIMGQYCGVRIYGGASRGCTIKSMKLFARKSYSPENGKFATNLFGTQIQDGSGAVITEYDKLVLRNSGNDFQFAFIRDELCQTLAAEAGFTDYEAVVPAVVYLNGEYYGFFWLHESYCDDYFKDKYPNEAAQGKFIIAEGTDREKDIDEEDEESVYSAEYNEMYEKYSQADLTDDTVYGELCEQIDVENYLDYFAFNIYINNRDWPQNNFKCYRYNAVEGEAAYEGVYDGRWRYLLHDMDYSMGLYEQAEVQARYNNLKRILDEKEDRYSPLFAALMEREDCRSYFCDKIYELADGVLDGAHITEVCKQMNGSRQVEQMKYYSHMSQLSKEGDDTMWANASHLNGQLEVIYNFASRREDYMRGFIEEFLSGYETASETETEAVQ